MQAQINALTIANQQATVQLRVLIRQLDEAMEQMTNVLAGLSVSRDLIVRNLG